MPTLLYGGDYNPEQWPEGVWREDVRLMRAAGVNLVTLPVFGWARLQPAADRWDFGWLDRVLELLAAAGIGVDLATATASPPPWLARAHPEMLPVTADGTRLWPGGRQHYCPSSPVYREAAVTLARRMAERYGAYEGLRLWHVGNEYGCHVAACWCDLSAADFRDWLRRRYGTLDALNDAWGTAFWSQRYGEWEEILPPRVAPAYPNPTQQLDFRRFSSDALLACYELERAVLGEATPEVPVTTNLSPMLEALDGWRWAARQDVVSWDSYPDPSDPAAPMRAALACDLMRSLGGGRPWLLMEQTPSQVNWRARNPLKRPGQMRLWSLQAVGRGADGILFFQWRASRAGAEKYHGGMVPHVGVERSRVWDEVVGLGAELGRLGAVVGARVPARVALLLDWDSWWALELDSKPSTDVRQWELLERYYAPLYHANVAVDLARPDADLSAYALVVAPNLYLLTEAAAANLERYVEDGGTLVVGFFSGIVDEHDHVRLGGYPALLRRLLGLRVAEFDPLPVGAANGLAEPASTEQTAACDLWCDVIELEGAEAAALFTADFYAGRPAITRHRFGRGTAWYVGTRPEPAYLSRLLRRVCNEAGVDRVLAAPAGVEAVRRTGPDGRGLLFLLNHIAARVDVTLPAAGTDLLSGAHHAGRLTLPPLGAAVLAAEYSSA